MSIINRPEIIDTTERYKMSTFAFALLFMMKWIDSDLEDFNARLTVLLLFIGIIIGGIYYYAWRDKLFIKKFNKIILIVAVFYIIMAFLPKLMFE